MEVYLHSSTLVLHYLVISLIRVAMHPALDKLSHKLGSLVACKEKAKENISNGDLCHCTVLQQRKGTRSVPAVTFILMCSLLANMKLALRCCTDHLCAQHTTSAVMRRVSFARKPPAGWVMSLRWPNSAPHPLPLNSLAEVVLQMELPAVPPTISRTAACTPATQTHPFSQAGPSDIGTPAAP